MAEEIVVPERAPIFAVGDCFQARRLLYVNCLTYRCVFYPRQLFGTDSAIFEIGLARILDDCWPQQAADMVSAKNGFAFLHQTVTSNYLAQLHHILFRPAGAV